MPLIRVDAARGSFTSAPVALVACQVNFEPIMRLSDPAFVASFQEGIREQYPSVSRVTGLQLTVGGAGLRAEPADSGGWAFASADQTWQVTLSQDALTIQSREHGSYEELRNRFLGVLQQFVELCRPGARTRLGLRYINRLTFDDVTSVEAWRELLRSELLGVAGAPELVEADAVKHSFGQARFADEESQLVVRYGFLEPGTVTHPDVVPPEAPHFVLDMDQFDVRRFENVEVDVVAMQLDSFHDDINRLFRWSLTAEGAARLGFNEDLESSTRDSVQVEA